MYGVVRFLDTPLLPASSPEDYPKVIKSGIDEEGQHHKSPHITGPSGIATLLHNIGRPQLLERLFDTEGTEEYNLRVFTQVKYFSDIYVERRGLDVEASNIITVIHICAYPGPHSGTRLQIGFINSEGEWAQHGVRYRIVPEPTGSCYRVGKWIPLATSDLGSGWGGSDVWVRAQGAAVAKAVWFHKFYDLPKIEVSWSGITEAEEEDLAVWLKERAERLAEGKRIEAEEYEMRNAKFTPRDDSKMGMLEHYRSRMTCRADCGEQNPKSCCSKCKIARYCSATCQLEDWKYHRTSCGTEKPIPEEYLRLL